MSFVPSGSPGATTYESSQAGAANQGPQPVPEGYQAPVVAQAPPAPMQETIPPAPAPSYVWAPGYWYWYDAQFTWVPGRWLAPYPGYFYVGARWHLRGGSWTFVPGGWSLSVGGPIAYPILLHSWGWGRPYAYPRPYVVPPFAPRRYGPPVYVAPRHHHHYVAPPVRSYRAPAPRHRYTAPPVRSGGHHYTAPPARSGGHHYTAPPARGGRVRSHHR